MYGDSLNKALPGGTCSGADPGFLERGFIYKGMGVRFADFSVFLNIP